MCDGILSIHCPKPFRLDMIVEGNTVGSFRYDTDKNNFTFEGKTDKAAEMFVDAVCHYLGDKLKGGT